MTDDAFTEEEPTKPDTANKKAKKKKKERYKKQNESAMANIQRRKTGATTGKRIKPVSRKQTRGR